MTLAAAPVEKPPRSLPAAVERLRNSDTARELLGDEVVEQLAASAEHELEVFEREVTDVERRRSFECS